MKKQPDEQREERIRTLRETLGLSGEQLADLSDISSKFLYCSVIPELLSGYSSDDAQKILTILTKAFFLTAKGSSGAPHPLRLYKFLL